MRVIYSKQSDDIYILFTLL